LIPGWLPWGVADPLFGVWLPWGRGRSSGARLAAVVWWPVPWTSSGRCGGVVINLVVVWPPWGVAGPLVPVWPPWGVADPLVPVWRPLGRGRYPGPRLAAVGAWPVPWSLSGCCGGVAGPLIVVSMP